MSESYRLKTDFKLETANPVHAKIIKAFGSAFNVDAPQSKFNKRDILVSALYNAAIIHLGGGLHMAPGEIQVKEDIVPGNDNPPPINTSMKFG